MKSVLKRWSIGIILWNTIWKTKYKLRNTDKLDWQLIIRKSLTENVIREFKDKVNWTCISNHLPLNEEFIIEFQDKIDWEADSKYGILSYNFIRKFQVKLICNSISRYQSLSTDLILEFPDKVKWGWISKAPRHL